MADPVALQDQNSPAFWRKKVFLLSYPIILSNIFIPLPGIVDTMVLGRLDDETYLGGVALSTVIYSFIYWGVSFLRKGATGFGAQAYGKNDLQEMWAVFFRGTALALFLALFFLALRTPIALFSFWAFEASAAVEHHAQTYYFIRLWGAPAAFLNMVFLGWLLAWQDARRPMILQVVVNLINVVLDLWFVLGLGMAVEGVALATVIAEYCGVGIGIYFVLGRRKDWPEAGVPKALIWNIDKIIRMMMVSWEMLLRSLLLMFAFAYQTAAAAKLGDTILAANVILGHLFYISTFALDGFADACETLVGKAVGAKDRQTFSAVCRAGFELGFILAALFSLVYCVTGDYWVALFTSLSSLQETVSIYLIWMILLPLFGMWCFIYDGIYFGATYVVETRNAMLISVVGYLIVMQVMVPLWGNHGIQAGMCCLMIFRGLTQWYYYGKLRDSIPLRQV